MSGGWFGVDRDTFENGPFKPGTYTEREAYLWLAANAAWADSVTWIKGEKVEIKKGDVHVSLREMQRAWGWKSAHRCSGFLKRMHKAHLLRVHFGNSTGHTSTIITVWNYIEKNDPSAKTGTPPVQNGNRVIKNKKQQKNSDPDGSEGGVGGEIPGTDLLGDPVAKPKRKPKMAMPENWVPTENMVAYAIEKGLNSDEIKETANDFCSYWNDRTDQRGRKTERGWDQAWRNRILDVVPRYLRNRRLDKGPGVPGRGSKHSVADEAARRRIERGD